MLTDIKELSSHKFVSVPFLNIVEFQSICQDRDAVIIFFRRWGCMLSRLWAKEVSQIANTLKNHDIKFIGVGTESTGAKKFAEAKYFAGELYYVKDIKTYQSLEFKKIGIVHILASLLWKESRDSVSKALEMGLCNDFVGDSLQHGGALLIRKNGEIVNHYVQNVPADRLTNKQILAAFDLKEDENECDNGGFSLKYAKSTSIPLTKIVFDKHLAPIHTLWTERRCKSSQSQKFSTKI